MIAELLCFGSAQELTGLAPKPGAQPEDQRVAAVENVIHSTLEARGSKREVQGAEWFDTTLEEVEIIVF